MRYALIFATLLLVILACSDSASYKSCDDLDIQHRLRGHLVEVSDNENYSSMSLSDIDILYRDTDIIVCVGKLDNGSTVRYYYKKTAPAGSDVRGYIE